MRKKLAWRIAGWLFAIAAVVFFCAAGWFFYQHLAAQKTYAEVQEEAVVATAAPTTPGPTLEEILNAPFEGIIDAEETKIPPEVFTGVEEAPIDFAWLRDVNPELYAWIYIPDTQIDYPIGQHAGEDQEYYLHHDLYGTPQFAGCIFSQAPNALDFSDPVTVLYGHNMKNGSMFQNLYFFLQDPDFFNSHKYIYLYMDGKTLVYEVISAYYSDNLNLLLADGDDEEDAVDAEDVEETGNIRDPEATKDAEETKDPGRIDYTDEEVFMAYLEDCRNPRVMERMVRDEADLDVELNSDSRILTLSTCRAGFPWQRYLVQAVLAYEKDVS